MSYKIPFTTKPVIPEQRKTLFISAGHSDKEPGAIAVHEDNLWKESEIVLEFRDLVCGYLNALSVDFTRDGSFEENLPLRNAIKMAKAADVALEFHCNAFSNSIVSGVEVLCGPQHKVFSDKVVQTLSNSLGILSRGVKNEASGQHSRLGFISTGGGIIVELFFITNKNDLLKYQSNKHAAAKALANLLFKEVTNDVPSASKNG